MKILQNDLSNIDYTINENIPLKSLAFSSVTFSGAFIYANFECLTCNSVLLSFSIPIIAENEIDLEEAKILYEDMVPASGLLLTRENLGCLISVDFFKKYTNDNFYNVVCVDASDINLNDQDYFTIELNQKQFLIVMAIVHDILNKNPLYYNSHFNMYSIPENCEMYIIENETNIEVEAINQPDTKISTFGDPEKEFPVQVSIKTKVKDQDIRIIMNLSYNRLDARAIQKKCTLPKLDLNNVEDKDIPTFIVVDHTFVDYSIKAKNPISRIVWLATGTDTRLFSMLANTYINITKIIYEDLIK